MGIWLSRRFSVTHSGLISLRLFFPLLFLLLFFTCLSPCSASHRHLLQPRSLDLQVPQKPTSTRHVAPRHLAPQKLLQRDLPYRRLLQIPAVGREEFHNMTMYLEEDGRFSIALALMTKGNSTGGA
eukprot:TRINITY_DN2695_c0_g2_i1.p1 TRINITY_DN2695_c0_g2~~TRINITY_DN2695_c0_g2_i1.p1  ORF type:complete len:126 (+),score=12.51 TRINITY_DN2695_c0_g2_i1:999-1376(+)